MQAGAAVMGNLNGKQLYGIVKRPAAQKKALAGVLPAHGYAAAPGRAAK